MVVGLKDSIEVYAWAQKPYCKFMAFKSFPNLQHKPLLVDLAIEEETRMKVLYGSNAGKNFSLFRCCLKILDLNILLFKAFTRLIWTQET